MAPCRLIDTRLAGGLDAGDELELDVTGACGVPAAAVAAALTVTVTATEGSGFATVFPADVGRPDASTSNWDRPGQTRANTTLVRLSDDGAVRIWVSSPSHVVVDVAGAFVPAIDARRSIRRDPAQRLLDTRTSGTPDPGRPITVALPAEVPADALALAVNLTLTETTGFDFVAASAAGRRPPATSVLNADGAGQTRAAGTIVARLAGRYDVDGRVREPPDRRRRRLFHRPLGGELRRGTVRSGDAEAGARHPVRVPPVYDRGAREIDVTGATGGPVAAVVANWTLTQTTRAGWLATYPVAHARRETSTINSDTAGQTVANLGIVPVSDFGVTAYSDGGTHLVVDVTGWFTGAPVAATEQAPPANDPPALPGCFPTGHSAVADKTGAAVLAVRGWRRDHRPVADDHRSVRLRPPAGRHVHRVLPPAVRPGLHGEVLNHFVAFYRTPRGNRIGFHEVVNQDPSTVGIWIAGALRRGASGSAATTP